MSEIHPLWPQHIVIGDSTAANTPEPGDDHNDNTNLFAEINPQLLSLVHEDFTNLAKIALYHREEMDFQRAATYAPALNNTEFEWNYLPKRTSQGISHIP